MILVLFWLLLPPPQTMKGETMSKKALRGPFSSCHLNQSLACDLACQIASLLQNLQLITLYPNGTKLAHLNSQEMQGSILSNLNNTHVRDGLKVNYREISLNIGNRFKLQSCSLYFSLTTSPTSRWQGLLLYTHTAGMTTQTLHFRVM